MRNFIDINSDVGERPDALLDGSEERLIAQISSANIACGVHAGDPKTLEAVIHLCVKHNVAIGAHPSYPDRQNFGRRVMNLSPEEIEVCVCDQVKSVVEASGKLGQVVQHVKPHGALYNEAARNADVARAIGRGVASIDKRLILFGLAGSRMLAVWRDQGFDAVGEAFADRRYEHDGSLRSRAYADAMITDPGEAAAQAIRIANDKIVVAIDGTELGVDAQTICVHSDTPNSQAIAGEVRRVLISDGFTVASFSAWPR